MGDTVPNSANKDEALRCLEIAKAALQQGDLDKSRRFANKANQLHSSPATQAFLRVVMKEQGSPNGGQNGGSFTRQESPSPTPSPMGSSAKQRASSGHPDGLSGAGLRQRSGPRESAPSTSTEDDSLATPEQRDLVKRILSAKGDFYAIMDVPRAASDDDLKRAYKKLALKLHPDKCKARGAEEAFKRVSCAFACLSDPEKRAYYNRTGHENSQQAAAAAHAQASSRRAYQTYPGGGGAYYNDFEVDPEEIFRAFFGGGFGGGGFGATFPGAARQRHRGQHAGGAGGTRAAGGGEAAQQRNMIFGLLQLLIPLFVLVFIAGNSTKEPGYSLVRDGSYSTMIKTPRLGVPYYVKPGFERSHPRGGEDRVRLERQVEEAYLEVVYNRCRQETYEKQRLLNWGRRDLAEKVELKSCDEFKELKAKLPPSLRNGFASRY